MEFRFTQDGFIISSDLATHHMHPAFFTDEACPVADLVALIGKGDRRGTGILEAQLPAQHGVAAAVFRILGAAFDPDRSGGVGAIAPLGDVKMMDAPA